MAKTLTDTPIVGLVGLGNAGAALAGPLSKVFTVLGHDLNPASKKRVAEYSVECIDDLKELGERSDIVLLSLPHPDASIAVTQTLLAGTHLPKIIVETSTVTPQTAHKLHGLCSEADVNFLDAAIGGGVVGMAAGKTTFLVGGDTDILAQARPVLDSMASTVKHMGPIGAGMGTKVVINAVYHAVMVVLIEAAAMAKKLDVPLQGLTEILLGSEGMIRPLSHRLMERIAQTNYEGGMSVSNARKDSLLALETAQSLGVPLYAIQASHTPYEIAQSKGLGDQDYAVLATLWEEWLDESLQH